MTGKLDFLELFSGSAKLSQAAAMQGLRVGAPIDLRTGYDDLLTAEGERQWKSLSDNSQKSSTWHLFVDHGVKCRILMILQILIRIGKSIFPWQNFVPELLFIRLNMADISSLKILRLPRFGLPDTFKAFSRSMP